MCEMKPSGKCNVPEHIHQRWKKSTKEEKEAMCDELDSLGWSKDMFVTKLTKTLSKTNKLSKRKKRGWFTKEAMARVLNWSASYIKSVVEYCERPGNIDRLTKKDRYNKKLKKYYVVYEEGDEELSEDEERQEKVADDEIEFQRLGHVRDDPDSDDNKSEKEAGAKEANSAKSVQGLESACETLEREYEGCEQVRLDVSGLESEKNLADSVAKEHLKKIDAQIRKTTGACSKVNAVEVAARYFGSTYDSFWEALDYTHAWKFPTCLCSLQAPCGAGPGGGGKECRCKPYTESICSGPSSKRACRGICHACMAGQELDANQGRAAVPFEDFSPNAAWVSTRFQELPWDVTPPIVQGLHLSEEDQTSFFNIDLWHNCHMGICKHFCASSFIGILESDLDAVPRVGMEAKFQWITQIYLNYFKSRRVNPFVREISRDTMNFPAGTACPIGKWSKGQASTEMMMFLHFFCRQYIEGNTADPLLLTIADAARALNLALSTLYRSGYWLQKEKAALLAKLMFRFLALYAKCAELTLRQGKRRFAMVPKLHMLAHAAFDLQDQSSRAEWAHNPLAMTNQIQEDFIGRPSRISRRVNIRSLHKSLIMRTLIVYQDSWRVADSDERGMDGYPDV
ncbi:unnamed protein product [Durusdinium trenchii]|uniref:Uncharacterized protein n=1 Tax=Durusdinium trenchii TaxID=1381693 RepID=A0ABP0KI79_9DINO